MQWDAMHPLGIPAHNLHACMHCAATDIVCMHARAEYNSIVLEVTVATEARCVSRSACRVRAVSAAHIPPHAIGSSTAERQLQAVLTAASQLARPHAQIVKSIGSLALAQL
jgi:hypothetical protein